jgi:hypothetical protein
MIKNPFSITEMYKSYEPSNLIQYCMRFPDYSGQQIDFILPCFRLLVTR